MIATTLITSALAPVAVFVMSLQSGGEYAIAIRNDNPETWTVEYPRLIQPYVADYRGCLNYTNRLVQGVPDFEAQHRSDVPRCSEARERAIAQSVETLADAKTRLNETQVRDLFDAIGTIHIQRGRDLDDQFTLQVDTNERAEAAVQTERREPLVITLEDPSVVKPIPVATSPKE